jgi:phage head maturation protease
LEKADGLHARGQIELSIPNADRLVGAAKAGALFLSVGVIPRAMNDERAWLPAGVPNKQPGGRVIKSCDLIEISLTARPMGYGTSLSAKSLRENATPRELEKHLCQLGLTRREAQRAGESLWPIVSGDEADDSAELAQLHTELKILSTILRS